MTCPAQPPTQGDQQTLGDQQTSSPASRLTMVFLEAWECTTSISTTMPSLRGGRWVWACLGGVEGKNECPAAGP